MTLALGQVDAERLWPDRDDGDEAPTLNTWGVREQFVRIVQGDASLLRAWTEHLAEHVRRTPDGMGVDLGFEREISSNAMASVLVQWAEQTRPASAWDDQFRRLDYVPDVRGFGYANLLLQIDPGLASGVFEVLKLPTFVQQAMQWGERLSEDKVATLAVLDAAAPVFEGGGWTRNIVALLALELAIQHAEQIDEALRRLAYEGPWREASRAQSEAAHAAAVARLREDEVPAWFRLVFEHVLARSDGREVLLIFAPSVSRRVLRARQVELGHPRWDSNAVARQELAKVFRQSGVVTADLRRCWEADGAPMRAAPRLRVPRRGEPPVPTGEGGRALEGDGIGHLMGALSMLSETSSPSEVEATWAWFEELLRGRDPGVEFLESATGGDSLTSELGATLAHCGDPLASFARTYWLLEPQRRRAEHAYRYVEYRGNDESLLLLRVALYAAAAPRSAADPALARRAESLFDDVYAHARRLWLTVGWGDHVKPEELVAVCFAFVPAIFGARVAEVIPGLVRPIATDPGLCLRAAGFLWRNSVPVDSIVALFRRANVDLVEMARDEGEWWGEGEGRPQWFDGVMLFVRCLELDEVERRAGAVRVRALERSRDDRLRGRDALDDWLAAEGEVAVDELRAAKARPTA